MAQAAAPEQPGHAWSRARRGAPGRARSTQLRSPVRGLVVALGRPCRFAAGTDRARPVGHAGAVRRDRRSLTLGVPSAVVPDRERRVCRARSVAGDPEAGATARGLKRQRHGDVGRRNGRGARAAGHHARDHARLFALHERQDRVAVDQRRGATDGDARGHCRSDTGHPERSHPGLVRVRVQPQRALRDRRGAAHALSGRPRGAAAQSRQRRATASLHPNREAHAAAKRWHARHRHPPLRGSQPLPASARALRALRPMGFEPGVSVR